MFGEKSFDPSRPDGENATLKNAISPGGWPELGRRYVVPAREGRAVHLKAGHVITVTNPRGSQVCDFWAFAGEDLREVLSMEHSRTSLGHVFPRVGDILVTNRRRGLLEIVEDSSPGVHDTVIASCDLPRYQELGVEGYHDNCTDNLRMALLAIGARAPEIPCPFNIWMNIPIHPDGRTEWLAPVSKPGDYIRLRAMFGCVAVMSACPQDMTPVNGINAQINDLTFKVEEG